MKKSFLSSIAILALSTSAAFAHVTANPDNGKAGDYFQTSFRVSHGCDGSATKEVQVKIPAGFTSVHPQFKPGWTATISTHKLDKPVPAGHGKMSDTEVTEIIWKGGPLPDDQYDEFGIVLKLPEKNQTLWFPVTQVCEKGQMDWVGIPAKGQQWHDVKNPAPFVKVGSDKPMHDMDHMDMMNMPGMDHSAH